MLSPGLTVRLGRCVETYLKFVLIHHILNTSSPTFSTVCATQKLEAKVLKKSVNGLEVAILPDEIRAILPTAHLSDHMSNCPLLWESLQEGDNISNLICINKNKQNIVS